MHCVCVSESAMGVKGGGREVGRLLTHCHSNGHVRLCHSVHGAAEKWRLQRELSGQS